jgi:hypothetical protein
VYDGYKMVNGRFDTTTLTAQFELCELLLVLSILDRAVVLGREALEGWETLLEQDKIDVTHGNREKARCAEQLSRTLTMMGDTEEAMRVEVWYGVDVS